MSTITVKYSQPMNTVVGDPASIAANMAVFKAQEKALLSMLGDYNNKKSKVPSTTPGQFADWTVDLTMPSQEEIDTQLEEQSTANHAPSRKAPSRAPASAPKPPMQPDTIVSAVSASSAVGGSGDPSDMLKTTLPQCTKDLLMHIMNSWKGGYNMSAHNTGMQKLQSLNNYITQLTALIPTAIPDGVPACTTGMTIYQQISMVIKQTFLKMPQELKTSEVRSALMTMTAINTLNQAFAAQIPVIIYCSWMTLPPELKLPTAYINSTIIINAITQLFTDWLSGGGSTVKNLGTVEKMLNSLQV